MKAYDTPRSATKTSNGLCFKNSLAFFDEEAATSLRLVNLTASAERQEGVKLTQLDHPLLPALAIGLGAIHGVGHHT